LGLSFLCSVVCFVFLLTYLFFGFITSCCISLLYVIKIPNDFLSLRTFWICSSFSSFIYILYVYIYFLVGMLRCFPLAGSLVVLYWFGLSCAVAIAAFVFLSWL
jgi:hypothetical protein